MSGTGRASEQASRVIQNGQAPVPTSCLVPSISSSSTGHKLVESEVPKDDSVQQAHQEPLEDPPVIQIEVGVVSKVAKPFPDMYKIIMLWLLGFFFSVI